MNRELAKSRFAFRPCPLRARVLAACAAALAGPALAQEVPTAAGLLGQLLADCESFVADSAGMARATTGDDASGVVTPDGARVMINRGETKGDIMVSQNFSDVVMPGGRLTTCTLTVHGYRGDLPAFGFHDLLAERAKDILGEPAVEIGGPVLDRGSAGWLGGWVGSTFPSPISLHLLEGERMVSVSYARQVAE